MRLRLLLILLLAVSAMGADCGGGGSSSDAGSAGSSSSVAFSGGREGGDGFTAPVPEPSAMLVFGVGLLIAGAATRRNR